MKDGLGQKILIKFPTLGTKWYSYLADESDENKRQKQKLKNEKLNLKIKNIF